MADDDSDVPEEVTAKQGLEQDEEIRKVEREHKTRVAQESKERRRRWSQRRTPRPSESAEHKEDATETESHQEAPDREGMLPNDIVNLLAARERQVFSSDSEVDDVEEKCSTKKKRTKSFGTEPVILTNIPHAQCLQNSLDFLKERKMQVSRSHSILKNSSQALRFISRSGLLGT
ncbi:hypothetical protein GIB67_007401 [Kingdonia uniflora]|uniref:Uncharacterized protein n=1 Tax=Kingdonia uniflora TaxID=39325 RepID=A0A7J7MLR7_9MAGN|nr:hypothetical protein GIB67_007401 [Kingdonia uniflora]